MIDYIIIGLLILIIILVVIAIIKNINESNITERLGKTETNLTKEISDFKFSFSKISSFSSFSSLLNIFFILSNNPI